MSGEYIEKLKSGGELVVSAHRWSIKYYFSGPDLRYNGTFITVNGNEIDQYIYAWQYNYAKYLQMKNTIPPGGSFEISGEMGMSIRIGFAEGVCIHSYHMPIDSQEKLEEVISDYKYAKSRAIKLQEILKSI